MSIPKGAFGLMKKVYKEVIPTVHMYLEEWKLKAEKIPDAELRRQALLSIESKTFHCEGGGIYGILANEQLTECIRFVVAYQTISDYLDNLCDRSTSLDPVDFSMLHRSMKDALSPGNPIRNYYRYRDEQEDGGYLASLVQTCQEVLTKLPNYSYISPLTQELASIYCDLQVHKHVSQEERLPRLQNWFEQHKSKLPDMTWYEFSACAGSTLGIFCLVSYAFRNDFGEKELNQVPKGLFPYVQGLHILLDYFIDQEEDKAGGDLNFCFYYPDEKTMINRFAYFFKMADRYVQELPHKEFHQMINRGLLGIYLSDSKVHQQKEVKSHAKKIIRLGGFYARFFYLNGRLYRKLKKS